jgi:hypothetical protein
VKSTLYQALRKSERDSEEGVAIVSVGGGGGGDGLGVSVNVSASSNCTHSLHTIVASDDAALIPKHLMPKKYNGL